MTWKSGMASRRPARPSRPRSDAMCGIAGYLRLRPENSAPISPLVAREMLAAIRRRGPDGECQWRSADALCWLGHPRLALLDPPTGDPPIGEQVRTNRASFH